MTENYLQLNREAWNNKVESHLQSDFYNLAAFEAGWNSLREIEIPLLGDLAGKSVLHLQCHFGQDTLSMARQGALCTGIDLSDKAIAAAQDLSSKLKLPAHFIACDLYRLQDHVQDQFDIVFSSYGTIGWLPDLKAWAQIIFEQLKVGAYFVFAEFHPVLWMYDSEFKHIDYSYFNKQEIREVETGTYADPQAPIKSTTVSWNHSLAEVLQALLDTGLKLEHFQEFDYSPYPCFQNMTETGKDRYQIKGLEGKLPMVYALKMRRTN